MLDTLVISLGELFLDLTLGSVCKCLVAHVFGIAKINVEYWSGEGV